MTHHHPSATALKAVTQADREARVRTLLEYEAGYSVGLIDVEQHCSVWAKHAIAVAIRYADEEAPRLAALTTNAEAGREEISYDERLEYERRILNIEVICVRLKRLVPEPNEPGSYVGDTFYPVGGTEASHQWDGAAWHWLPDFEDETNPPLATPPAAPARVEATNRDAVFQEVLDALNAQLEYPTEACAVVRTLVLAGRPCETIGPEDMEPGCCAPCRARAALTTGGAEPDHGEEQG
jgi:hypothetical protein